MVRGEQLGFLMRSKSFLGLFLAESRRDLKCDAFSRKMWLWYLDLAERKRESGGGRRFSPVFLQDSKVFPFTVESFIEP